MTCNICDELAERPKRTLSQPIRFAEEYYVPSSKRCKKPTTNNNLYEIEVNRDRNLVHIQYKGYSEKFQWKSILLRLRPVELMSLIKFSYFLVYITVSVIYTIFWYIYRFLTGAVIYTKGYSGTDGDHTRIIHGQEPYRIIIICDIAAGSNDRTLVFRQKWRKTGKLRETNYEKVFSVCKIETTLIMLLHQTKIRR